MTSRTTTSPCLAVVAVLAVLVTAGMLAPAAAASAGATVTVDDGLRPALVEVRAGSTLTWHNADGERHRMRSVRGPSEFDTGNIERGERASVTLTEPGTYDYVDHREEDDARYHGSVRVVAATAAGGSGGSHSGGGADKPPGNDRAGGADDGAGAPARSNGPASDPSTGGGGGHSAAAPAAVSVDIVDRRFSPASVSVPVGSTVTWRNSDDRPHTATGRDFDSGILDTGATFRTTFDRAGTFTYICELHPEMRGTITVGSGGPSSSPAAPPSRSSSPGAAAPGGADATAPARSGGAPSSGDDTGAAPAGGRSPGADAAPATHDVDIVDFAFAPAALEVRAGDRVRWTNTGLAPHTATSADAFDSGILDAGGTFATRFDEPGTFEYRCVLHPEMVATVTVVAASAPATTAGGDGGRAASGQGGEDSGRSGADVVPGEDGAEPVAAGLSAGATTAGAGSDGSGSPVFFLTGFVLFAVTLVTGLNRFLRMAADESH